MSDPLIQATCYHDRIKTSLWRFILRHRKLSVCHCAYCDQGWTYGLNEDVEKRRSPHLVHYANVDEAIKVANRNTASETVRTLLVYGYVLDPPSGDKVGDVAMRLYTVQSVWFIWAKAARYQVKIAGHCSESICLFAGVPCDSYCL